LKLLILIFLTFHTGGGIPEAKRASELSELLGLNVSPSQVYVLECFCFIYLRPVWIDLFEFIYWHKFCELFGRIGYDIHKLFQLIFIGFPR
jgi:hypothetical protein